MQAEATVGQPMNPLRSLLQPAHGALRAASRASVSASLLWIPQAFCLALLLASLAPALTAGTPGSPLPWQPLLAFVGLALARMALDYHAARRAFEAADTVMTTTRERLLTREARRSPQDMAGDAGAFATLMAEKVALLQPYVLRYRVAEWRVRIVPLVIVLAVLPLSWIAALILLLSGPLIPLFMVLVGQAAGKASEHQLRDMASMNSLLLERLAALVDIRVLDASERSLAEFRSAAEGVGARTLKVLRIAFLSSTMLEFFAALGVALMAVHVGFNLLGMITTGSWGTPLSLTEGLFLLLLAPEFYQPLRELGAAWHDRAAARAVAEEIEAREAQPSSRILGQGQQTGGSGMAHAVSVHSESLEYTLADGQRLSFPDMALDAGQLLAITGPSGSGKSTLLMLLGGLLRATHGQTRFNGETLDDDNADALRQHMAWLSQLPCFVAGSLQQNLLQGAAPDTAEAAVLAALADADALQVIERLPGGLGARLGEDGSGVSGGEARRLAIARMLLRQPRLVLADEPTADLDQETAALIRQRLLQLRQQDCTLIVATHDQQLVAAADQVIELQSLSA